MYFDIFKHSLKSISKQKLYSFINILGLAIGICTFLLIGIYAHNERNYDRFISNHEKILRLEFFDFCVIPPGIGHILRGQIPEIENICRYESIHNGLLKLETNDIGQSKTLYVKMGGSVDSTFLRIFDLSLLSGNKHTALSDPHSIILTKSLAIKLFGNTDAMNKVISLNNETQLKVTGIIDDSKNFHLKADYYIPFEINYLLNGREQMESIQSWNYITYFLLRNEHQDLNSLRLKIFDILKQYDSREELITKQWQKENINFRKLTDIYFHKDPHSVTGINHGNKILVDTFIIIAVLIILIALINFINLTTARASTRAKEVGIKKVVGVTQIKLIFQFITESTVISSIAMLVALTLLQILLPEFNNLTSTNLILQDNIYSKFGILSLILITLIIGIIAGLYPAFYISLFKTTKVLKGDINRGKSASKIRIFFIVSQFIIASALISGTILINKQIHYLKNKDLGFKKEFVINMVLKDKLLNTYSDFKTKLLQKPSILSVSFSHGIPGFTRSKNYIPWVDKSIKTRITSADPDYFKTFDIKIIEGRGFSWNMETDKRKTCLINEKLADIIGRNQAVGKRVNINYDNYMWDKYFNIIGIFEDYHFESLHSSIEPMAIFWADNANYRISIKISSVNVAESLKLIENTWKEFEPEYPFAYNFLDQQVDNMYLSEESTQELVALFSLLAIFIASIGLFGLSAFMINRRIKEIGVRKVLGSSTAQITLKLSKEFAILVIISNIISILITWLVINNWLDSYPYQINIPIWPFLTSFFLTLIIALITVSFHTIKTARSNPINAIRHE